MNDWKTRTIQSRIGFGRARTLEVMFDCASNDNGEMR